MQVNNSESILSVSGVIKATQFAILECNLTSHAFQYWNDAHFVEECQLLSHQYIAQFIHCGGQQWQLSECACRKHKL